MVKIDEILIKAIANDPYNYAKKLKVDDLVKILEYLSASYYNSNISLVSDTVYDMLRNVLIEKDPKNKFLTKIGAEISKNKVQLPYTMPSLDKIKPDTNALDTYTNTYKGPYLLSDKLDGVSGLLYKKNNTLKLYTRGDGFEGQDISYLIEYIIPKKELIKIPNNTSIRGEIIISKKNFTTIKDMANARNAVSGLVNSKTYKKRLDLAKKTDFVAYAILFPRYKYNEQMKKLKSFGIKTVYNEECKKLTNEYLSELLTKRRTESEYEVDGIVVGDSSKVYENEDNNPSHAFAFKQVMTDQIAEVVVRDVLWSASKDGYMKPRIEIEPVTLVGVVITYATAFNAKFVVDNKLGPGSIVKLVRSGDVIPHILKVISPSTSGSPKMPSTPYKWNKTKVDIISDINGDQSDIIKVKRMRHFFKLLKIKYLDEGILTLLVKNGIDTIQKVITTDIDEFDNIPGLGEKMYYKINDEITKGIKNSDLATFMAASQCFGRGIGRRKIRPILQKYPNILNEKWTTLEVQNKIHILKGYEITTAKQFANGLIKFKNFFESMSKIINLNHLKKVTKIQTKKNKIISLENEKIVFTGFRDKELEEKIEKLGGKVSTSVSSNTTLIVYADNSDMNGSKIKKGIELKIKMMKKSEFANKYK